MVIFTAIYDSYNEPQLINALNINLLCLKLLHQPATKMMLFLS